MSTAKTDNVDATFEQIKESGEQLLATARKFGNLYLDSYEDVVERAIELEYKWADTTRQEWLKNLIEAQADFARELGGHYTSTARTLLK